MLQGRKNASVYVTVGQMRVNPNEQITLGWFIKLWEKLFSIKDNFVFYFEFVSGYQLFKIYLMT